MHVSYERFFRVNRCDIAYLKFIIESYEGVAVISTVDNEGPLVRILSTPSLAAELDLLLAALSREIVMTEAAPPPVSDTISKGACHA